MLKIGQLWFVACGVKNLIRMEKIFEGVKSSLEGSAGGSFDDEFLKAQKNLFGKLPSPENFKHFIEQLKDMSEEDRQKLLQNFAERAQNADAFKELFTKKNKTGASYLEYVVFIVVLLLIIAVFGEGFFTIISTL